MNRRTFLASLTLPVAGASGAQPARKRRSECFLGMHFDLHPNKNDKALGRDVSEEMVERFIEKVKPDFVQYDCKGHAGWLGYPSRVSPSPAGIVNDSLAVWRRVTARHGVALFIHFSGVWDSLAVAEHPEWARVRPDGKPEVNQTSLWGPYADQRMIPQLKESAEKYDLDGAWVDGECWATNPDYAEAALQAFAQTTGIRDAPKKAGDPGWNEFLEFNRARFRQYVRHYIDALHAARPGFRIASNWLYSTFVPERPDLPVDFISGDYLGNAAISNARLEARYIAATGKPWDLMAWGFQRGTNTIGHVHKPAVQLQQEAAVVLAQGGGFQIYYQPTRAGRLDDRHVEVMAKVASFCRARQEGSFRTESVPQVGVLLSTRTLYRTANKLFGGWGAAVNPIVGPLDALIENHYSVDVVPEWKLKESVGTYPLLVVPDWTDAGEEVRDILLERVRAGGRLLVIGANNAALFGIALGVRLVGEPATQPAWIPGGEVFSPTAGLWQDVEPHTAKAIEQRFPTYDSTRDGKCAATVADLGSGKIAAIYGPLGSVFAQTHAPATRIFLGKVVETLFEPGVKLDGPPTVEVSLRRKNGTTLLHLGNTTAMQVASEFAATDFIPSVGPLTVALKLERKPSRVTLEPGGRPLSGEWRNGWYRARVDKLELHAIVAVRP